MRMMKLLLCLLVLVLITSLSFATGEGGWKKYINPNIMDTFNAYESPSFSYQSTVILDSSAGFAWVKKNEDGTFSKWTVHYPMAGKGGDWESGCASDKYIYLSGGKRSGVDLSNVYQLQILSDDSVAIISSRSMLTPKCLHGSLVVNNDKLFIFAGNFYGTGMSSIEYCQLDSKTGNMGSFQAGPTFNKIRSSVFASFILNNTVYCVGLCGMPKFCIESAPILEDNTLGPWKVVGGPYTLGEAPIGATFTGDSTLFVMLGGADTNPCYVMDLKDGGVQGKSFKAVTSLQPGKDVYLPGTIGLGSWDRYVCFAWFDTYVYDPWLTSAPLFEESNSNLYE